MKKNEENQRLMRKQEEEIQRLRKVLDVREKRKNHIKKMMKI